MERIEALRQKELISLAGQDAGSKMYDPVIKLAASVKDQSHREFSQAVPTRMLL